ncbi:hypothetical protein WJX73_004463 [Symbiochloris irregularis]|uniref:AP-2 complex subunit alpha n=1 Tax=Symbiochloris irregularis TaxID=706552 RepID=A0AAW1NYT7_9CHLO
MAKLQNMRGLQVFIADIRSCSNRESEKVRVDKELGKIRKKFASNNSLSEYDKKKYVWKLLYIFMLGYDVEFGHKQAADLISASKYAEKQVGYMACAILLNEKDEFLRLIINSIRNDLISRNEAFQCLALGFVGNVGGAEMAALLTPDVMTLLMNGAVRPIVRKKCALCLLRLMRKSPSDVEILTPEVWSVKLGQLLEERDNGVLLGVVTLLLGVVARNYEGYEGLVPRLVKLLEKLRNKDVTPDYAYYGIPSPWLQAKTLRVLQYFPQPDDPTLTESLIETLRRIITGTEVAKNINKNNAQHAIVFEAVALALAMEVDEELLGSSVGLLGKFISVREPNIKYLGLENMVRLAEVPAVQDIITRHQKSISASLKDADVSIRRRALDLLFTMCNTSNAADIVDELLRYLEVADFSLRDELVLKTAILAERFYPNLQWYVDVMLSLIERAGEFATRDIWHATLQLITNDQGLHEYAARKAMEALQRGASNEPMVCVAGYLLGEYGRLVTDVPISAQFALLQERFVSTSPEAKAMLLTAFLKLLLAEPKDVQLRVAVENILDRYSRYMDSELQQRAVEYLGLERRPDVAVRNVVNMPPWEKRKSLLLRRMAEREGQDTDEMQQQPAWMAEGDEEGAEPGSTPALQVPSIPSGETPRSQASANGANDLLGVSDDAPTSNGGAPAQAPAAPVDPLADLYSIGTAPAAASQPEGPRDPFAMVEDPYTSGGNAASAPIQPLADPAEWYRKLLQSNSGVFYEDSHLQVGMKLTFQGSDGQITFFFGNKSPQTLERVICVVPPDPKFHFQLGPVPPVLHPKQQVQVPLSVVCTESFLQPPRAQLGYHAEGQTVNQTLALPLSVGKFITPPGAAVPREAFFARWRAVAGPPYKLSERVSRLTPIPQEAVERVLAGLNLGVQPGLDPDAGNVVAVGTFGFTPPRQTPQQVACMRNVTLQVVLTNADF